MARIAKAKVEQVEFEGERTKRLGKTRIPGVITNEGV